MAKHAHITTRRAMLVGIAAAPVIGITGSTLPPDIAAAATASKVGSAPGEVTLWDLWNQCCHCEAERDRFNEFGQPTEFWLWENRRLDLEKQIITTQVRCLDDLRGKIELVRRDTDPIGSGVDDDLVISIVAGFDRLFPR